MAIPEPTTPPSHLPTPLPPPYIPPSEKLELLGERSGKVGFWQRMKNNWKTIVITVIATLAIWLIIRIVVFVVFLRAVGSKSGFSDTASSYSPQQKEFRVPLDQSLDVVSGMGVGENDEHYQPLQAKFKTPIEQEMAAYTPLMAKMKIPYGHEISSFSPSSPSGGRKSTLDPSWIRPY